MCFVCIATCSNINRNVYMYLNTRIFPTTGYARVLLLMFIRRGLGGTVQDVSFSLHTVILDISKQCRRRPRRLIRVSTLCLQIVPLLHQNLNKSQIDKGRKFRSAYLG